MILYLDVCCLNRPFDDQTQDRIRLESEAILLILGHIESERWQWVGSEAIDLEIRRTPDTERRRRLQMIALSASRFVRIEQVEENRAEELHALGFHPFDALHIACAESGGANIFLTADDRLLRLGARHAVHLKIRVANPLTWLQEEKTK